jgi:two-component system phosphate regulon sensor histidine kinase PhoR
MNGFRLRIFLGMVLLVSPVWLIAKQPRLLWPVVFFWFIPFAIILVLFWTYQLEKFKRRLEELTHEDSDSKPHAVPIFPREYSQVSETLEELRAGIRQEQAEREQIRSILYSIVEGIVATDASGRISFMNPVAENIFGLKASTAIGRFPREVWREFDLAEIFHQVFVTGEPQEREIWLDPPAKRLLKVHLTPIRAVEEGEVQGVLAVIRDLTRLRHLETVRSDFVANVSHELRTPLTSIKGFVETLLDGGLRDTDAARRFLNIISQEADRLNRLIHDLLDLSKMESGRTELHLTRLFLAPLVEEIRQTMDARLAERNIGISVELGSTPVWADEDRIREVLVNLIDNAIKYTTEGGLIRVSEIGRGDRQEFIICDNGIGIPKESLGRIFERFYRVDKARSREMGGTGLGLSIVKHIIDRHGGRVWVESEWGKGSCFHFTLAKYQDGQAGQQE